MGREVKLFHWTRLDRLPSIRSQGLDTRTEYGDFGLGMRRDVVFCWLRREDNVFAKGAPPGEHAYLEVLVEQERCRVADMTWISFAQMFRDGSGAIPANIEAGRLWAEIYKETSVPLAEYVDGMFGAPEVLVKGGIAIGQIKVLGGEGGNPHDVGGQSESFKVVD